MVREGAARARCSRCQRPVYWRALHERVPRGPFVDGKPAGTWRQLCPYCYGVVLGANRRDGYRAPAER